MVANPKRQLSLDTNVLLDLAHGRDFAQEFREEFQRRGYALMLAPTVLVELEYLLTFGSARERALAEKAYDQAEKWCLTSFDLPEIPNGTYFYLIHGVGTNGPSGLARRGKLVLLK